MKLRPIGQDDRLSIVDHLDELRSRVILCLAALLVAFCVCFWQNHLLLNVLNRALPAAARHGLGNQGRVNNQIGAVFKSMSVDMSDLSRSLSRSRGVAPGAVQATRNMAHHLTVAGKRIPQVLNQQSKPLVIGVGESFVVTVAVAAYFAVLLTLPLLLYQVYAFVIPALSRDERRVATPTVAAAPLLFLAGAVFTYFAVLPPAVHFLQGYNSTEFQVVVGANSYYKFEIMLMMGIGVAFEVPLLLLGLQRVGVISASTLTLNWRYALVLIAVIVAALPGVDPVTMTMEMLPLVALYVLSIVLLKWVEHRNSRRFAESRVADPADMAGDSTGAH
ncbi:MAG: twin-arginine translocase subunit TatC [Acidobacteriota bacterium]|nr:twin-arginine translocase subunit TatC [Acidobacteriota bacterium]